MAFELPALPYAKEALQPYMSAETLDYHHGKHHNAYVVNLNNLVKDTPLAGKSLEEIVKASFGDASRLGIFNNAGQHWNHIQFWNWMKPNGGGAIPGELEKAINRDFGSVAKLREDFINAGVTQFGSGWAWLIVDGGQLKVMKTPNAENPLAHGKHAILGVDVWEHSYYIDYRNLRQKYLEAFFDSLINWDYVAELYGKAG